MMEIGHGSINYKDQNFESIRLFSNHQLKVIREAIKDYLVEDVVVIDTEGNVRTDMTLDIKKDAKGIGHYLGLSKHDPQYDIIAD